MTKDATDQGAGPDLDDTTPATDLRAEQRALTASIVGTLFMGVAGVVTAILSNSQAILLDGLFSFVGFAAALFARRVSARVLRAPDRIRPFGYGAEESIFTTFRALSLLGVVLFAIVNAISSIGAYIVGQPPAPLNLEPIVVYLVGILLTCLVLWVVHHRAWKRSKERSEILRLEANAAAFDGAVTAAAGVGLLLISALEGTSLSVLAPIGDSIIVLALCSFASVRYFADFRAGLAELAGTAVHDHKHSVACREIAPVLSTIGATLVDLAILKTGRVYSVAVFIDPGRPVSAEAIDTLNSDLEQVLRRQFRNVGVLTVITAANDPPTERLS